MVDIIRAIYEKGHLRPLDPVSLEEGEEVQIQIRRVDDPDAEVPPTARDLLRLPLKERDRLLEYAAAQAVRDYQDDPSLTAFEAFDQTDFYDETP